MKKNSALEGFCARFQQILDALDEYEMDESLEELNAQFEDTLFFLDCIDQDDEDAAEEIEGALDDLADILNDYRDLAAQRTELQQITVELEMALQMAAQNLI